MNSIIAHGRKWPMHIVFFFNKNINNQLRGVSRMESLGIILQNYHGPALSIEEKESLAEKKSLL